MNLLGHGPAVTLMKDFLLAIKQLLNLELKREQIRNYDFEIAKDALESLGYVQEEKRINGVKARWWFKRT